MTPEQRKHEEEKHRRRCGYTEDLKMTLADVGKIVYMDELGDFSLAPENKTPFGVVTGYSPEKEVAVVREVNTLTFQKVDEPIEEGK